MSKCIVKDCYLPPQVFANYCNEHGPWEETTRRMCGRCGNDTTGDCCEEIEAKLRARVAELEAENARYRSALEREGKWLRRYECPECDSFDVGTRLLAEVQEPEALRGGEGEGK